MSYRKSILCYINRFVLLGSVLVYGNIVYANEMLVNSLQDNTMIFGSELTGFYNKTHNSQRAGFDLNVRGFSADIQSSISDSFLMKLGYVYADATVKNITQKANIETDSYYIYGKYQPQKWYVAGQFNYHYERYKDKHDIIKTEKEKTDIYQSAIISGYHLGSVHNYSGLKYTYVNTDKHNSITPTGNGEVLTATIGTQYAPTYSLNKCTSVKPILQLAGSYDIKSNNNLTVIDMPETNTVFALYGKRLHRASLKAGVGIGLQFKQAELSANYDVDWRVSHISQTGKVALKYRF